MIVFDIETQYLAAEVGGWGNKEIMRLSVGCTWDEEVGYLVWWEAQAADLVAELRRAEMIVGFNVNAFDFHVLSLYGDVSGLGLKTFDLLDEIFKQTGRRVGLNVMAKRNLGEAKAQESGVVSVSLWRAGRLEELIAKCQTDVELTKRLFELWEAQGMLYVTDVDYVVWPGTFNLLEREDDGE